MEKIVFSVFFRDYSKEYKKLEKKTFEIQIDFIHHETRRKDMKCQNCWEIVKLIEQVECLQKPLAVDKSLLNLTAVRKL